MAKKNNFRKEFATARKEGKKEFSYGGKKYTTRTAEEDAMRMTDRALAQKIMQKTRSDYSSGKSDREITESYVKEKQYRMGDKMQKKGLNPSKYRDRMKSGIEGGAYAMKRPSRLKKKK